MFIPPAAFKIRGGTPRKGHHFHIFLAIVQVFSRQLAKSVMPPSPPLPPGGKKKAPRRAPKGCMASCRTDVQSYSRLPEEVVPLAVLSSSTKSLASAR